LPATVKTREEAEAVEAIRAWVLAGVELILLVLLALGKSHSGITLLQLLQLCFVAAVA
jgi:hypothetical protein